MNRRGDSIVCEDIMPYNRVISVRWGRFLWMRGLVEVRINDDLLVLLIQAAGTF